MTKFVRLRVKNYIYLIDNSCETKKAKTRKRRVIKGKLKFKNYKNCLEATELDAKMNYLKKKKLKK